MTQRALLSTSGVMPSFRLGPNRIFEVACGAVVHDAMLRFVRER